MKRRTALAAMVATLAGCGGGGGDEAAPVAQAPSPPASQPAPAPGPAPTPAPAPAPAPSPTPAPPAPPPVERRNVWQYTEDLLTNRYTPVNGVRHAQTMTVDGIKLHRFTAPNFYGALYSNIGSLGLTPFEPGELYLVSSHVFNAGSTDQFAWMRTIAGGNGLGHGAKLPTAGSMRRIWTLARATDAQRLDLLPDPTVALGATAGASPCWLFQGNTEGGALDVFIGGFQLEKIAANGYRDGIAMIGDSTMAGASGGTDSSGTNAREVSVWLGAMLNAPVFNRARGGERTDVMDARWATDITPLAKNCRHAVIQGGVNDLGQGRPLAQIQGSIDSMVAKAKADSLVPVLFTTTPSTSIAVDPAKEAARQALNAWMKTAHPNVIDIAAMVENPLNPAQLRPEPDWYGDGIHYGPAAKRAIGTEAAKWSGWNLTEPSPYQAVLTDVLSG